MQADLDERAVDIDRIVRDCAHVAGTLGSHFAVGVGLDEAEAVAAEARQAVFASGQRGQASGDFLQHAITWP